MISPAKQAYDYYMEITDLLKSDPWSTFIDEKMEKYNPPMGSKLIEPENLEKRISDTRAKHCFNSKLENKNLSTHSPIKELCTEIDQFIANKVPEAINDENLVDLKKVLFQLRRMPERLSIQVELTDKTIKGTKSFDNLINKIYDAIIAVEDVIEKANNKNAERKCPFSRMEILKLFEDQKKLNQNAIIDMLKKIGNKNAEFECPFSKMEIPKFFGNQNKWLEFSEHFKELVHNQTDLCLTKKLQYLKLSLGGDALRTVLHLIDGPPENYNCIWELLENKYKNSERNIFSEKLDKLLALPTLKEEQKVVEHFIDTVNEHVAIRKEKGDYNKEVDLIISHLVLKKFDEDLMCRYNQSIQNAEYKDELLSVMNFLEQLYNTLEEKTSLTMEKEEQNVVMNSN